MVINKSLWALAGVGVFVLAIGCSGGEDGSSVSTEEEGQGAAMVTASQVQDVLNSHCMPCHGGAQPKEGLNMESIEGLLKGAEDGPVVVPGDASASKMVKAMRGGGDGVPKMPPQGASVPEEKIKLVEDWINAGAKA
jgi:hypothetical protein